MNQQRKIRELFDAALYLSPDEQAIFLDRECGDNLELRRELSDLLVAARGTDSFAAPPVRQGYDEDTMLTPNPFLAQGTDRPWHQAPQGVGLVDLTNFPAGTRINQYEIIRELGRGGMGAVYLARDIKLARRVAIKVLQGAHNGLTKRFFHEAQATAQFNHENIVVIHDYGEHEGNPYMVLEYLRGTPLSELLRNGQRLPPNRAIELILPVTRALVVAHKHNIVHRDLKPDNIFITETGTVKVLDFGIAKLLQPNPQQNDGTVTNTGVTRSLLFSGHLGKARQLTQQGALVGTLPYMSPEQWSAAEIDHKTDLWAVGIILFRMVAGRHPLAPLRGRDLSVIAKLDEPMPAAWEAARDIPPQLADIIDRCLIKLKARRMGSASELLRALEQLAPGRSARRECNDDESPYAGLRAFQESDADRFFGRGRDISAVVSRLRELPLIAVTGPSGVGKSSLVRAGIIPALKESGEPWETLVIRPGRDPLAALAHVLAPFLNIGFDTANAPTANPLTDDVARHDDVLERLQSEPGFLGTVLRSRARRYNRQILLFVDQFEELYTLLPDVERRLAFTACLAGVADDATTPLRVVISIRSDFLDRVAEDSQFVAELTRGLFFLNQPDRESLRESLTRPAESASYQFEEPSIVEHMLNHLENAPGALPLLQFAATKLWDTRDTNRKLLTVESYQGFGGIVGALASHADSVLADLLPKDRRLVRSIFLRLVTPERTRTIVSVDEICQFSSTSKVARRLVDHLVQARLLVVTVDDASVDSEEASVEIVHESLIHGWPMLRRWLDENHEDSAFLNQLRTAARQWQRRDCPPGLLWRGEAVEEARRWRRRYLGELSEVEEGFLKAAFTLAERSARRRRLILGGVLTTLVLLCTAAIVAMILIRNAERSAIAQAEKARTAEIQARQSATMALYSEKKAREAEKQANDNLARLEEEVNARQEAEKDKDAAEHLVKESKQELIEKNTKLEKALQVAERAKEAANLAAEIAESEAERAGKAEQAALEAKKKIADLLKAEQERLRKLEQTLGSPRMNILKE